MPGTCIISRYNLFEPTALRRHLSLILVCFASLLAKGDNIYQQRLASLGSIIPLPHNQLVQSYIEQYTANPDSTAKIIGLWKVYSPIFEASLLQNNQPAELRYLALALSGMNPAQTNGFGASGFWGMLFDDAKNKSKLKINSMVDERRDLQKSTAAAAGFFKDLHNIYSDWQMAIAAYTSMPSNVNKAIVNASGSSNFWDVQPYLPAETKDAVPRFIAAAYIANFYEKHGIHPVKPDYALEGDSVQVERHQVHFGQVSLVLNIPLKQLQFLNPVYKMSSVPFNESKYTLILPKGRAADFEAKRYSIYTTAVEKPASETPIITKIVTDTTTAPVQAKVSYKVKPGETLVLVADYFDCTLIMAKRWNRLRSNRVAVGKVLYFWVKPDQQAYYQSINTMTAKQKKAVAKKD